MSHEHRESIRPALRLFACAVALGFALVSAPVARAAAGWSGPVTIDTPQNGIASVSCPSSLFCMAVDSGGNNNDGHVLTFNGTKWTTPTLLDTAGNYGPTAVDCLSSSFCVAVDGAGYAFVYNGSTWTADHAAGGSFSALSCASTTFCMAWQGDWPFAYNGSSWSPTDLCYLATPGTECAPYAVDTNGESILSVSCPSASFCAAAGHNGGAYTYDGSGFSGNCGADFGLGPSCYDGAGWTSEGQISNGAGVFSLNSVSCASASFCVAVAGNGDDYTYDGSAWSGPDQIDPGQGLSSVSCTSSTFCMAVDGGGNALAYNGSRWSSTAIDPTGQGLVWVSCASASFCMTIDTLGKAFKYAPIQPCSTASLRLNLVRTLGAAGHRSSDLALRNVGVSTCTLRGYPRVRLLRGHRALPLNVGDARQFKLATVMLRPGQRAYFTFEYTSAGPCLPRHIAATGLAVVPPNNRRSLLLATGLNMCTAKLGGRPEVTPMRAALDGL